MQDERQDIIEGKNAVTEALIAKTPLDKIYIASGEHDRAFGFIAGAAKENGVSVVYCDKRKLDAMSATKAHQGVVAVCAIREYAELSDLLDIAKQRGEAPFIIMCDEITDPQNLGAIIRSAECFGAHGVVITKRRSAGMTAIIGKTSAGAAAHIAVARVSNLVAAINELKKNGVWIYGTAGDGQSVLRETDLKGPICIVIGSEGKGVGRLISENCDFMVNIPMVGKVSSLNAAAAASIFMYEAMCQRKK